MNQGSGVHVVAVWQAGHDQRVLEHGLSAASPDMPQVGCAGVADAVVGEEIVHDGRMLFPCAELPCMAFDVEEREVFAVLVHADASHIVGCGQAVLRDGKVHAAAVGVESLDGEAQLSAMVEGALAEQAWQMVRACDACDDGGCVLVADGLHDDAPFSLLSAVVQLVAQHGEHERRVHVVLEQRRVHVDVKTVDARNRMLPHLGELDAVHG